MVATRPESRSGSGGPDHPAKGFCAGWGQRARRDRSRQCELSGGERARCFRGGALWANRRQAHRAGDLRPSHRRRRAVQRNAVPGATPVPGAPPEPALAEPLRLRISAWLGRSSVSASPGLAPLILDAGTRRKEKSMRASVRFMGLAGLVLLLLAAAAPAFAASDCAALRAAGTKAPRLESNEFFQVVSPTKISFRPGVQFETVRTAEGKSLVRFSFETLAVEGATDVQAIECRCQFPDVCTRNSCKV